MNDPMVRDNPTVEDWVLAIERGLKYRQKYGMENKWAELEALFYNAHDSSANVGPNLLFSTGDALLSTLSVPEPYVMVKPLTPDGVRKAPLVERVDNHLHRQLNVQEETQKAALHAYLYGRLIFKLGYDSEYGFDPSLDVLGDLQLGMTFSSRNREGLPIEFNRSRPGMPWVKAVLPHDIVVPWGTVELEDDARWVAHRVVRHIEEVKADPKYTNTDDLHPNMSMEDFVHSYTTVLKPHRIGTPIHHWSDTGESDVEYVELWEIHDRQTGRLKVIASGYDQFLRDDPDYLQLNGSLPFVSTCFVPNARTFWVTPDAYYIRHAQVELADIAQQATKQRRLSVLKFLYQEDAISDVELQKLLSGRVGAGVRVEGGHQLNDVVQPIQAGNNQMLYQDEQYVRNNAREQVGFSRNQFGEFAGRRTSASEAMIVDQASALRMSRRELRIKRVYEDVFKKLNDIVFNYWQAPQVIDVLGQHGGTEWLRFTGPQLKSTYSYNIILSDQQGLQGRRQEAIQLYAMLSQDPAVDPIALRHLLIDAFGDPQFTQIFRPEVSQGAPMLQQLLQQQGQAQAQARGPSLGQQRQIAAQPAQGGQQ